MVAPEVVVVASLIVAIGSGLLMTWPASMPETLACGSTRYVVLGGLAGTFAGTGLAAWHYQWVQDPGLIHPWWWGGGSLLVYGIVCLTHGVAQRHAGSIVKGMLAFGVACLWR